MLNNGVHETTSSPSNTQVISLTASTERAAIRISDAFSVGDVIQYMMRHTTENEMEEGLGVVTATNQLDRDTPTATLKAGTYDKSPSSRVTFTAGTVDVWAAPISRGIFSHGMMGLPGGETGNLRMAPYDAYQSNVTNFTPVADRLYVQPVDKYCANDVQGLVLYMSDPVADSELFLWAPRPDGAGPGELLASALVPSTTPAGLLFIAFDGSPVLSLGMGVFFTGFISSGSTGTVGRRSGHFHQVGGEINNAGGVYGLSASGTGWVYNTTPPALTGVVHQQNSNVHRGPDLDFWLVKA